MRGFIDLHSHWIAGIDDGAKTIDDARALLTGLYQAGFDHVVATPHMRPGMFDNTASSLRDAYARTATAVGAASSAQNGLPAVSLSSEHFFDDVVYTRLLGGEALPYPGGRAVLVEIGYRAFPARLQHRLHDLSRRGLRPVLAHPERYEPVWADIEALDPLLDVGTVMLLDVAALAGKYGRTARKTAEALLDAGYYQAACSDAHKPSDVAEVAKGIRELQKRVGEEETKFLLTEGPRQILEGTVS
ncbi:MAG: protein tyrosine phosphatase [Polyangiaceae bacterium]|nr:protein tyrosine phosphatase [Polyangiaceae bacterium]